MMNPACVKVRVNSFALNWTKKLGPLPVAKLTAGLPEGVRVEFTLLWKDNEREMWSVVRTITEPKETA